MTKIKQLTIRDIDKLDKQFDNRKEIYVLDGKYKLVIDKKFRPSKIQKMIIDYIEFLQELRNREVTLESVKDSIFILQTLIIKYFTNLKMGESVDELIVVTNQLLDIGVFEEILNSFDKEEIDKLNFEVEKCISNLPQIGNQIGEIMMKAGLSQNTIVDDVDE